MGALQNKGQTESTTQVMGHPCCPLYLRDSPRLVKGLGFAPSVGRRVAMDYRPLSSKETPG